MRSQLFAIKPATPVLWAGLALVLLGFAPTVGRADVIIGNINAPDGDGVKLSKSNYAAASFTMGSQAYSLSDVQIRIHGGPAGATFQLRDDASGHPSNNVLHSFTSQNVNALGDQTITFPAGSPFTLAPNSTYWLVGLTGNGSTQWVDSNPNTTPMGSGANFGQYEESSNSGGSWSNASDTPKFQLDGTPAAGSPEPSSLVLMGTVACVAAAAGWRRRRIRAEPTVVTTPSTDVT